MTRLLIVAFLIAVVVIASRRRGRKAVPRSGRGKPRVSSPGPHPIGAPERLVCGACGTEFDPEKSGWICPKCGK
jgi:hypothetical protein